MFLELEYRNFVLNVVEFVIFILMVLMCLVGNSLICIVVYRNLRFCILLNFYLIVLVVSDIFNVFVVMLLVVGVLIIG